VGLSFLYEFNENSALGETVTSAFLGLGDSSRRSVPTGWLASFESYLSSVFIDKAVPSSLSLFIVASSCPVASLFVAERETFSLSSILLATYWSVWFFFLLKKMITPMIPPTTRTPTIAPTIAPTGLLASTSKTGSGAIGAAFRTAAYTIGYGLGGGGTLYQERPPI